MKIFLRQDLNEYWADFRLAFRNSNRGSNPWRVESLVVSHVFFFAAFVANKLKFFCFLGLSHRMG